MMVGYQHTVWVIGGFVQRGSNPTGGRLGPGADPQQEPGPAGSMARHCIMRAPPARPQWWGTRSSSSAGGPATPRSWSRPRRFTTAPAGTTATPIPVPGDHLAAASDGTYLYAVGGAKLTSAINTAAVQRFDPATGQWTQLTHLQTAANAVGAAIVDGQLITVGGSNLGTVFNTVRAYNLTTKTWSSLAHLPAARPGMGVAVIGNNIYAIDGAAQPGHLAPTSTVQVLRLHR